MKLSLTKTIALCLALGTFAAAPAFAKSSKEALYASAGETMYHYDLNTQNGTLALKGEVKAPVKIQYANIDATGHRLFIASSNMGIKDKSKETHYLQAVKLDAKTGDMTANGAVVALPDRPINTTLDKTATHIVAAYNRSATMGVYNINKDGSVGTAVAQPGKIDAGIYPHQVRVSPSGQVIIAVGRGNDATANKREDIGRFSIFSYKDGVLTPKQTVFQSAGIGPRHMDFHPTKPYIYSVAERGNKLLVFKYANDTLSEQPIFVKDILENPASTNQRGGAIHMLPNGNYLYVTNRNDATTTDASGKAVLTGGENNIAVYKINAQTGEPTIIQHIDTQGIEARTFAIDPTGKYLVIANQETRLGKNGKTILPNLAVFKVAKDGKLSLSNKYELNTKGKDLMWVGITSLE